MFICGSNFVGGSLACALTPTGIDNINYVEIKNGVYDDLYITRNTEFELSNECPKQWDFDTYLWAKFNNSTNAGNIDWNLETCSHIILKSRVAGQFKWKTIYVKEIHDIDDFWINYPDYYIASGQPVEYAVVNVLYGSEGTYSTVQVTSKFDKMFISEGEQVWGTEITDGFCDTTRKHSSSSVELLNNKYPIFIRNTIADYDTGTCNGSFVPMQEQDECELAYDTEYDYSRIKYQKDFMDYICDGVPKILKLPDGRLWIMQVTADPTDTADTDYNNRKISFPWVEVGDVNSEEDLYYLGLSNITEEWWTQ